MTCWDYAVVGEANEEDVAMDPRVPAPPLLLNAGYGSAELSQSHSPHLPPPSKN